MNRRAERLATAGVALAVILGAAGRFVTTSPMWLDEALSVNIARLPLGDITEALRHDGHPPLYYWLLHGWTELFGAGDLAARSLSGLLSLATLPLAWVAGRRIGGRAAAACALVVFSLAPFCLRYATEARMYSLVMLLVLAGYLLLTDLLARPSLRGAAALAVVTGALLLSHYWSLYLAAALGALMLLRWRHRAQAQDRRGAAWAAGALVAGGVLFAPWLPVMLDQARHTGTPWAVPARPTQVLAVTLGSLGGRGEAEAQLLGALTVLVLLVALLGRSTHGGQRLELDPATTPAVRWELAVVGATLALGAVAGYLTASAYEARYAATVMPLVLLSLGVGFSLVPRRWPLAVILAAWLALALAGAVRNVIEPRTQAGELADAIAASAQPGDLVVTCPDQLGPSVGRALDDAGARVGVATYPSLNSGRFVDWRDYEQRNDAADPSAVAAEVLARADGGSIWLVSNLTYRTFEGDCELLASSLAAQRPAQPVEPIGSYFESAQLQRFPATG